MCELPLIGAPQKQHKWWTEGVGRVQKGTGGPAVNWGTGLEAGQLRSVHSDLTPNPAKPQEGRKVKPIPHQPSVARKTSRTGLGSLKPSGLFFFKFSLLFFLSFSFYSFFLSFKKFLKCIFYSHKWDNKNWSCERTRVRPKEGSSQQLRQWDKFHFAIPENLQVILYLYYYFFITLHLLFYYFILFYFSSFSLVFFTWFSKLHCLSGFPCSLFHSVFLIFILLLHSCSNSVLL